MRSSSVPSSTALNETSDLLLSHLLFDCASTHLQTEMLMKSLQYGVRQPCPAAATTFFARVAADWQAHLMTVQLVDGLAVCINCHACRAVATLAEDPEFHLSKKLQPGDIEIIHNPTIFHARSEVVDGEVRACKPDGASHFSWI